MGYTSVVQRVLRKTQIPYPILREAFAEFLGTFLLVVFGDGAVAQWVLFSSSALGTYLSVNLAFGMGITFGVYVSGGVSGGHINPAVSLAMSLIGRLQWRRLPVYMLSQYLGAFVGAAFVYGVYYDAINNFDALRTTEGATATAGIFATYPPSFVSTANGFADQVMGSALLVGLILAITDKRNMEVPKYLVPVCVGAIVFAVGASFGTCGFAINPARDLGPRILTACAGYGIEPFSFRNYNWFWVPVIATHLGAVVGAIVYLLMIESHWPCEENNERSGSVEVVPLEKTNLEDMELTEAT